MLATLVELAAMAVPLGFVCLVTWSVGLALPQLPRVETILVLLAVAIAVGVAAERLSRRLLPLSVLLRMSMMFPDRTPSRFSVARDAGNPRTLTRRLESPDVEDADAAAGVLSLVGALSAHDRKTRGHSERVRAFTDLLSAELGLGETDRDRLRWAGLLHDIGKLQVSTDVLNKPGKPSEAEWAALKRHPDHGAELAAPLLPWLGEWGQAIAHHHERYDGTGYPRNLAGDQISLGGRIVAVVDSFETMTAARSYKKAMSHRAAREELARCAGTQFDPALVRAFLQIPLPQLLWAMGPLATLVQLPFLGSLRSAGGRLVTAGGTATTAVAVPALVATAVVAPGVYASGSVTGHTHRASMDNVAVGFASSVTDPFRFPSSTTEPRRHGVTERRVRKARNNKHEDRRHGRSAATTEPQPRSRASQPAPTEHHRREAEHRTHSTHQHHPGHTHTGGRHSPPPTPTPTPTPKPTPTPTPVPPAPPAPPPAPPHHHHRWWPHPPGQPDGHGHHH